MSLSFSKRSKLLEQSEIRNMSIECDRVGGINLSQGICDLPLPEIAADKAIEAIKKGANQYSRYDGLVELRQAIAEKVFRYNKIKADPENNIVVSAGSTGALYSACLALFDPGDEVIVFEPYYGYHISTLLAVGAIPKYVKMHPPSWTFNVDDLESAISSKTKGIIINTPANPSGKVFSMEELKIIVDFSISHNIFIFTDEIYEYFVYDGFNHVSPASLAEAAERVITISGYSKTYSVTGWRVGYCICDSKWKEMIGYLNDLVYVCAPTPLQVGIAGGIAYLPDSFYENIKNEYEAKRNKICDTLKEIGLNPYIPNGSYYVLVDATLIPGRTSKEKAMYLLEKTKVATVPGGAFYHDESGENLLRFCFAKDDEKIDEACEKLKKLTF